jgi:hypothetical protein
LRKAGVTHPDRLFVLEPLPLTLSHDDATYAIVEPARQVGVLWEADAAETIIRATSGHPAHLQLFADVAWGLAAGPDRITADEARAAAAEGTDLIERRTLTPRWNRLPDRQMEFLAALSLHGGQATAHALSSTLHRAVQELSWIREELLREGDIHSPSRGHLAMTVPSFGPFILERYEAARALATMQLLSLDEMRQAISS